MEHRDMLPPDLRREHFAALNVLRRAKNFLLWLAILSVAMHVGSWGVVRRTMWLRPAAMSGAAPAGLSQDAVRADQRVRQGRMAVETGLSAAGFVGRAAVVVLVALFVLALLISLSGQLGGARGLARACVWSLAALALLVPWDRLAPPETGANVPSAFFDAYVLFDLNAAEAAGNGRVEGRPRRTAWEVLRFAAYPLAAAGLLLAAQWQFRRAHLEIQARAPGRLPVTDL